MKKILISSILASSVVFASGLLTDPLFPVTNSILVHQKASPSIKTNVIDSPNAYIYEFEVPGATKKDLKVKVKDNMLIVKFEKKKFHKDQSKNYKMIESEYGSFMQALSLPKNSVVGKIKTKLKDGILTVVVPKKKMTEKIIEIQ